MLASDVVDGGIARRTDPDGRAIAGVNSATATVNTVAVDITAMRVRDRHCMGFHIVRVDLVTGSLVSRHGTVCCLLKTVR